MDLDQHRHGGARKAASLAALEWLDHDETTLAGPLAVKKLDFIELKSPRFAAIELHHDQPAVLRAIELRDVRPDGIVGLEGVPLEPRRQDPQAITGSQVVGLFALHIAALAQLADAFKVS
jgi:hypothetical protein